MISWLAEKLDLDPDRTMIAIVILTMLVFIVYVIPDKINELKKGIEQLNNKVDELNKNLHQ